MRPSFFCECVTRIFPGGSGGGWNTSTYNSLAKGQPGQPLLNGGLGGQGCSKNEQGHGDGGFGGGGGGCLTGGGGGGFVGKLFSAN